MLEVSVTIEAPELTAALDHLAQALGEGRAVGLDLGTAAAPAAASPQVAPVDSMPCAAPVASGPTYTVEQIGKAGADLVSQAPGKMPELLALLQKYGARAITELKPEQLGAFATELRGLGAKL